MLPLVCNYAKILIDHKIHLSTEPVYMGPQVSEVRRLGGVKKQLAFTILRPRHPGVHFLEIIEWSLST